MAKREPRDIAYRDRFEFAGSDVQIFLSELDEDDEAILQNYLEQDPESVAGLAASNIGNARAYVVQSVLEKAIVDRKEIKRKENRIRFLRSMRNGEGEHVTEEILRAIVKHEWWLATRDPYHKAFSAYKPRPEPEEGDGDEAFGEAGEATEFDGDPTAAR